MKPRSIIVCIAAALCAACGAAGDSSDAGETFLPFATHFRGYTSWEQFSLTGVAAQGEVHITGDRTLYINQRPPAGATEFPVGTIIVKVVHGGQKVFARAKRGGHFNSDQMVGGKVVVGSPGWEWFELQPSTGTEDVTFVWRGFGPPTGEGYGGDPNGCNSCHATAKANDYVLAQDLTLTGF